MSLSELYQALADNEAELLIAKQNADLCRMHELLVARSLLKDSLIELLQQRAA